MDWITQQQTITTIYPHFSTLLSHNPYAQSQVNFKVYFLVNSTIWTFLNKVKKLTLDKNNMNVSIGIITTNRVSSSFFYILHHQVTHLLTVPHYVHQIVLVKSHYPRLFLSLNLNHSFRTLLHFDLLLPELEKTITSKQHLFLPNNFINLKEIIRIRWFFLTHINIVNFKTNLMTISLNSIFLYRIILSIVILLLIPPKRYTTIHPHKFRQQSVILFLHNKIPHNSIWTSMSLALSTYSDSRPMRRRTSILTSYMIT